MIEPEEQPSVHLLWVCVLVEGILIAIAIVLALWGIYDHSQPLSQIDWAFIKHALGWGALATVPMLTYLVVFHFWTPAFYRPMQDFVDSNLRPMFQSCSLFEMAILSLMAGFGEELFFRWCVQGGVAFGLESALGVSGAIAFAIVFASLLFGICHWVNAAYGISTTIVGAYLGLVMVYTGSWMVPAVAHSIFDFIALIYIVRRPTPVSS